VAVLAQGSRGAPAWGIGRRGMALGATRACSWGQARGSTVATTVTHSAREVAAAMAVVQARDAGARGAGVGSGAVGLGQRRRFGPMARGGTRPCPEITNKKPAMVEFAGDKREDKENSQRVADS